MNKKQIYFAAAIGILVVLNGCGKNESAAKKPKVMPVKTMVVKPGEISTAFTVIGTVGSATMVNVISPEEGKIIELPFDEGAKVAENQIVAKISSSQREALVSAALAELQAAHKKLKTVSSAEDKTGIEEHMETLKNDLKFAQEQYLPTMITAPIKGTVIRSYVDPGDMVTAKSKLLQIADLNQLVINCKVSEKDISRIKINQAADVKIDAFPGKIFKAGVSKIYPYVDEKSRTVPVELRIAGKRNLQIGMFCRVNFIKEKKTGVIVVPLDSVVTKTSGQKTVFIADGGIARQRPVRTGISSNDSVEITEGLRQGEKLIMEGQFALKNGMKIRVKDKSNTSGKKDGGK